MVERCRGEVYPDSPPSAHYYVTDSSGAAEDSQLKIGMGDGPANQIPWSLLTFLIVSKMKYPSKAKLYCVQVTSGK